MADISGLLHIADRSQMLPVLQESSIKHSVVKLVQVIKCYQMLNSSQSHVQTLHNATVITA